LPITNGKELLIELGKDKPGKLLIETEVIEAINSYEQKSKMIPESGGCLLGFYRPPHIHITHLTKPMSGDQRSRMRFCRKDKRHLKIIKEFQQETITGTYIGEWHTHPEKIPTASDIDTNNWHQIFKLRTPTDTLFLILGTTHISIYLI
jgi:integrative and conjugative element protein (TIGR02256 family)